MLQGWARTPYLFYFIYFFLGGGDFFFSFIESFIFEQQVLFRTDYLCATSDFSVCDLGWGWRSKLRTVTFKVLLYFF